MWIRACDLDEVTFFCSGYLTSGAETRFDGTFTACTVYSHTYFTFYCFWSILTSSRPAFCFRHLLPDYLSHPDSFHLHLVAPPPPCVFSVRLLLTLCFFVLSWIHSSHFPTGSFLVCMTNFCLPTLTFLLRFTRDCFRSVSGFIETIKKMCWKLAGRGGAAARESAQSSLMTL